MSTRRRAQHGSPNKEPPLDSSRRGAHMKVGLWRGLQPLVHMHAPVPGWSHHACMGSAAACMGLACACRRCTLTVPL